ncbi:MAG: substrate-binding domain-containing protein [Candidatus Thermoplasmatota archaeon]|nr:substrate-binding domain-containing protein [Candidatus Thermoplasmatota archaeon]
MRMRWNKKLTVVAVFGLLIAGTLVMSGCTGSDDNQLNQTGSSTVLPLAKAWAEEYDGAQISVSGGGSSHGISALLKGEADLADASRQLKPEDIEKVGGDPSKVTDNGTVTGPIKVNGREVEPTKWVVAHDVLTVVVNNQNDWVDELNYTQLYHIFTTDDTSIYWDDVSGLDDAPHKKIRIYAPDEASGTYDYFFESIGGLDNSRLGHDVDKDGKKDYHPSADDNVILDAIKNNEYAIGYFGYAYYKQNTEKVNALSIAEEDEEAVPPTTENVADYPLSRPLHIYTDGVPEEGSTINDYLRYVLSEEGQSIVPGVGYIKVGDVSPGLLQHQLDRLGG